MLALPAGTTPAEGASCFVNPLTALGMIETMRREGHKALVHTAAASNLGQMLNKICLKDGIGLVNIVRSAEQADILRKIGAKHVVDSTAPTFMDDLTNALVETGATLAFDAIGGGKLAGQILTCMEIAANKTAKVYSRYGSSVHKQVYIYGSLDPRPVELNRAFGMAWGVGGWLLFPFLQKIGAGRRREAAPARRRRTQDHLCQPLHPGGVAAGGAAAFQHRRLRQARDRREIPDQSEQGLACRIGVTFESDCDRAGMTAPAENICAENACGKAHAQTRGEYAMTDLNRRHLLAGAAAAGAATALTLVRNAGRARRGAAGRRAGARLLSLQGRRLRMHLDQ